MRTCVADPLAFREALSLRAHAVSVITVRDNDGRALGMTATAVCPVSADSLLLLTCVDRSSRTHELIREIGWVGINILAANQTAAAQQCSANGHDKRLTDEMLEPTSDTIMPVLKDALVHFDCRVQDVHPAGSHSIIVLLVEQISQGAATRPLVYFGRSYNTILPLSQKSERKRNPLPAPSVIYLLGRWSEIMVHVCCASARLIGRMILNTLGLSKHSREDLLGLAMSEICEALGGAFAKLGQILSTRVDIFPPNTLAHLARLQDKMKPIDDKDLVTALAQALHYPVSDVFSEFDARPVASGTIASVYRARLIDGTTVAVKIRRPGVVEKVQADVRLLNFLAKLASLLPSMQLVPLRETMDEICTLIVQQLDLRIEAKNNCRFQTMFGEGSMIHIPRLIDWYCTDAMLTMEFIDGLTRVDELAGPPERYRPAILEALRGLYRMIFVDGLIHCDLHPGNIFFFADGQVVMLDTGFVVDFTARRKQDFTTFFLGLVTGSASKCSRVMENTASHVPSTFKREEFDQAVADLIEQSFGVTAASFDVISFVVSLFELQRRFGLRGAPDFTNAILSLLVYEGVVKQLCPDLDFQAEARPFVTSALLQGTTA